MISKTIGFRGLAYFQTNPYLHSEYIVLSTKLSSFQFHPVRLLGPSTTGQCPLGSGPLGWVHRRPPSGQSTGHSISLCLGPQWVPNGSPSVTKMCSLGGWGSCSPVHPKKEKENPPLTVLVPLLLQDANWWCASHASAPLPPDACDIQGSPVLFGPWSCAVLGYDTLRSDFLGTRIEGWSINARFEWIWLKWAKHAYLCQDLNDVIRSKLTHVIRSYADGFA